MCAHAVTAEDRTTHVEPAITPSMPWRIQKIEEQYFRTPTKFTWNHLCGIMCVSAQNR
jgi:hypothetical protein